MLSEVVLIDDDRGFVDYVRGVLEADEDKYRVSCAYDFAAGLEAVLNATGALYLIDLGLPDGRGVDLVSALRRRRIETGFETRALVVTVFADQNSVMQALQAGADGYILKDSTAQELRRGVEQALDGASPISAVAAAQVLSHIQAPLMGAKGEEMQSLSRREIQLLELFAKGLSYKEAARVLDISVHTVQGYVKSIYKKLSVSSRSEAVFEAIQTGIIKLG